MEKNLVSIIIPVYNSVTFIEETLKSIINQTYSNIEIICVDDCSTDQTVHRIKNYQKKDKRIHLLQLPYNSGISFAINSGVKKAKGRFIARIDADDIALPNRLEIQKQFLDQHPNVAIVGSWIELFGNKNEIWHYRQSSDHIKTLFLFRTNGFPHNSLLIKREIFDDFAYDSNYDGVEDTELWCRIIKNKPYIELANIPLVLTKYRTHDRQTSHIYKTKQMKIYRRIIKDYIEFFCGKITFEKLNIHYNLIEEKNEISDIDLIEVGEWKIFLEKKYNLKLRDRFYEINSKWHKLCKYNNKMDIFENFDSAKSVISYI